MEATYENGWLMIRFSECDPDASKQSVLRVAHTYQAACDKDLLSDYSKSIFAIRVSEPFCCTSALAALARAQSRG